MNFEIYYEKFQQIKFIIVFFFFFIESLRFPFYADATAINEVEQIDLKVDLNRIMVKLGSSVKYKIVQLGQKEAFIAFQGVKLAENFKRSTAENHVVQDITIETLSDNILTLAIFTKENLKEIKSRWQEDNTTLEVYLIADRFENRVENKKKSGLKAEIKNIEEKNISKDALPKIPESDNQFAKMATIYSIDNLINEISNDVCSEQPAIMQAVDCCRQENWQDAFFIMKSYLATHLSAKCKENAKFLSCYSLYKLSANGETGQYLFTADFLLNTIRSLPESKFIPYAMSALGKIYMALGNYNEAKAYFKMVMDKYKEYPGQPEVIFEIGRIYAEKGDFKLSIQVLREIMTKYPDSPFITDANLEIGKALFEVNRFSESLNILTRLMESAPRKIYENADLLRYIGNGYYQTGNYEKARQFLYRAYNYFPQMKSNHIVLARIGDTYRDSKQPDKALSIYKLTTEKYPGTDGSVISLIRLARYIKKSTIRAHAYKRIIREYPESPMVKLAMLKLASLKNHMGEHEKSIEILKQFLNTCPKTLKREADYAMKESYQALFEKFLKNNEYDKILISYEKDRYLLDRLDSAELFLTIGKAYIDGHLYEKATEILTKSSNLFVKSKTPPELIFNLGLSLHEAGQLEEALAMFNAYVSDFSGTRNLADAYRYKGRILLTKKKYKEAIKNLRSAYYFSSEGEQKATISMEEAEGYARLGNQSAATQRLTEAINFFTLDQKKYSESLSTAYRKLGENYLQLNSYLKAAEALSMAVNFENKDESCLDLLFMLAESYQKGNVLDQAEKIYGDIRTSDDSFWSKLAAEKLKVIKLQKNKNKNGSLSKPFL